ncbi:MAG TPA: hypothetical protein VII34_02990 [Pyrinomonadaceae bacterium]
MTSLRVLAVASEIYPIIKTGVDHILNRVHSVGREAVPRLVARQSDRSIGNRLIH